MTKSTDEMADPEATGMEALFSSRFHGAANIRGIRYQIIYSVLRALNLREERNASVRLEGIEDVDLIGFYASNEYVQVKSASTPWSWARLKGPVEGFLKALRTNQDCRFRLAVNFELQKDIGRLASHSDLKAQEKKRIAKKFRKLCTSVGGSEQEADVLIERISIESIPIDQVEQDARAAITDAFGLGGAGVSTYMYVLVSRFLEWAGDREEVSWQRIEQVRSETGEALAREEQFQAYGSTLIDLPSWEPDALASDFFEAKQTRPGHVAAGLDVRRPIWLERMGKALAASKVCVLRASSGQGKSTLLYRFAIENWPRRHTFIVQSAETEEQAGQIVAFVRHRVDVGLPVFLFLDNAGWSTRCWPTIARACSSLGAPLLVSTRTEDWHRFARETATVYEILEPGLAVDEAIAIHGVFGQQGRLHPSVVSAEWAVERTGEPLLLIEFVYLLTHGQMLEDRLREQIREITRQNEDRAKVEVVRRVAVASVLGAPVRTKELLSTIPLRDDPQQVLTSLSEEYLTINEGHLVGLHWVRSNHLVTILHEGGLSTDDTVLSVLDAVPDEAVRDFVANALSRADADHKKLLAHLSDACEASSLWRVLRYVRGAFDAGERSFFESHRGLFLEAYDALGNAGPMLLSTKVLPSLHLDTVDRMAALLGEKAPGFEKLREIAAKFTGKPRGREYCSALLTNGKINRKEITEMSIAEVGELLDWITFCRLQFEQWDEFRRHVIDSDRLWSLPFKDVCRILQGIYRYDRSAYERIVDEAGQELIGYLQLHTDSISIEIDTDNVLTSVYIVDPEDASDGGNEQAVSRLTALRTALPDCSRYDAQGIWLLPMGLEPSVRNSDKQIPPESLPARSDVLRNSAWRKTVEGAFLPDSFYVFQQRWSYLRRESLRFLSVIVSGLERALTGRPEDATGLEGGALSARVVRGLSRLPDPPPQAPASIGTAVGEGPRKWAASLQNFTSQVGTFTNNPTKKEIGRLAAHNFRDAMEHLPAMQAAFDQVFAISPDYFDARELNHEESRIYGLMEELLDPWLLDPLTVAQRDIYKYVRRKRADSLRSELSKLKEAVGALPQEGIEVTLPSKFCCRHPLVYVPLGFSVAEPLAMEAELEAVLQRLIGVSDLGDFFCLLPLVDGNRFLAEGFVLPTSDLPDIAAGSFDRWEILVPRELPVGVLECLPVLDVVPDPRVQFRDSSIGLICSIEVACRYAELVDGIGDTTEAERELRERHLQRVFSHRDAAKTSARSTKEMLISGPLSESSPAYRDLIAQLDLIADGSWSDAERLLDDAGESFAQLVKAALDESPRQ
ncbi:hypothetical protein [Engelhardtia mirabilis]|uniref:DUF4297 domain-containing protein n=1 Tax=Engelhardtia mirabilis TaxID=2528011 RepID=A0A518BDV6_9BACT|nr:hypothetical protein Pla133_02310 [Planctomycetes bacterium Pla133]QDU99493.1 hypothetical protein Pla86_02310 [Planctomycetes bacterium Pla86]